MRRVIVIAAAGLSLAGCSSFSMDSFKPTPPTVQVQLEFDAAGRRCPYVARTGLQDALLGHRHASRQRLHGHLHAEQVPAGDRSRQVIRDPRRFRQRRHGRRSIPIRCSRELHPAGPPPKPSASDAAEEAEAAQGAAAACRRIALPRAGAAPPPAADSAPRAADRAARPPLIACAAPDRLRIVRASHHA